MATARVWTEKYDVDVVKERTDQNTNNICSQVIVCSRQTTERQKIHTHTPIKAFPIEFTSDVCAASYQLHNVRSLSV